MGGRSGVRGLDAGHSLSLYERLWLHAWFAGAALVTPENSIAIFFEKPEAPWTLTEHGRRAAEVFRFMRDHDCGVPYTPVAVVLDHLAGYNGYMERPWGILEPTPGDVELRDLFDHQLFPDADHIHFPPDPVNPEGRYLRPTPYGEIFDVLLTSVPPEALPAYPAILLAGDITSDDGLLSELEKALQGQPGAHGAPPPRRSGRWLRARRPPGRGRGAGAVDKPRDGPPRRRFQRPPRAPARRAAARRRGGGVRSSTPSTACRTAGSSSWSTTPAPPRSPTSPPSPTRRPSPA